MKSLMYNIKGLAYMRVYKSVTKGFKQHVGGPICLGVYRLFLRMGYWRLGLYVQETTSFPFIKLLSTFNESYYFRYWIL